MSTPETPAEVLRRAAKAIRERAEPVPPSPWRAEGRDVTATQDYRDDGSWDWDRGYVVAACPRQDEAEHVASWSPPVALAVADLLDKIAWMGEMDPDMLGRVGCDEAIAIARTYLGETPQHPVTATSGQDSSDKED